MPQQRVIFRTCEVRVQCRKGKTMDPTHGSDFHPRDLKVRDGLIAPTTPTLIDLSENPEDLITDLFSDSWRPWAAILCGDGRWAFNLVAAINSYNRGGTDIIGTLGTVSIIVSLINENNLQALQLLCRQIEFASKHHGVEGIQVITHPLCGATKDEVCNLVPGGSKVFRSPTKVDPRLFLETKKVELEIHRRDLDIFTDWVFETFPFIVAVEYLRATKWRLEPFSHHEMANCRAIEVINSR